MLGINTQALGGLYWDGLPDVVPPFTIGCMSRPRAIGLALQMVACGLTTPLAVVSSSQLLVGWSNAERALIRIANAAGTAQTRSFGAVFTTATWVMQAIVVPSTTEAYEWRNSYGTAVGTENAMTTANLVSTPLTRFVVGGRFNDGGTPWTFDGEIIEPFCFRRALTGTELLAIWNGRPVAEVFPQDLAFYVPNLANLATVAPRNWHGPHAMAIRDTAPILGTNVPPVINFSEF